MSIQLAVDVPSSPYVNMDLFKKQLADYAQTLFLSMSMRQKTSAMAMKPLEQLSPVLQNLCGVCSVPEDDLNGDVARKEAMQGL